MSTLAEIQATAEAIEYGEHTGLLVHPELLPDADALAAIALIAQRAQLLPGGLAALIAGDYAEDPERFCARMNHALGLAAHLHHAEDQWPALSGAVPAEPNGGAL